MDHKLIVGASATVKYPNIPSLEGPLTDNLQTGFSTYNTFKVTPMGTVDLIYLDLWAVSKL